MSHKILILNGPNLNLLGTRQPEIYGDTTLDDIKNICVSHAQQYSVEIDFRQNNVEGALIDWMHEARLTHSGIILNAGAYTHTSVALMDAILGVQLPAIEIHMTNVHAREEFRHQSYISKVVLGQICGFGSQVYELAIDALVRHLKIEN